MFKKILSLLAIISLLVYPVTGCRQEKALSSDKELLKADFAQILKEARGQTVSIYMWGGDESVNRYMDEWVAPRAEKELGIKLKRVPINDAREMINKLLTEKEANQTKGSIDIMWINGENFKMAKENRLLWGPFADKLPNYNKYINQDDSQLAYDFGEPTEGLEAPWGKAQFVLIYDSQKVPSPPDTAEALKAWVKANPGRFTYPAPPDFTGSAFIRQILAGVSDNYSQYLASPLDREKLKKELVPLWDYLNSIEPYLWQKGSTYPENIAKLDELYASGEVLMTMSYNPYHADQMIKQGRFPSTTRTFVLKSGSLANTHYLAIPFNAPHKAGAMAAINYLLSFEAQAAKFQPRWWGDMPVISYEKISAEERKTLTQIEKGRIALPLGELEKYKLPELAGDYVDAIEEGWFEHVAKN